MSEKSCFKSIVKMIYYQAMTNGNGFHQESYPMKYTSFKHKTHGTGLLANVRVFSWQTFALLSKWLGKLKKKTLTKILPVNWPVASFFTVYTFVLLYFFVSHHVSFVCFFIFQRQDETPFLWSAKNTSNQNKVNNWTNHSKLQVKAHKKHH